MSRSLSLNKSSIDQHYSIGFGNRAIIIITSAMPRHCWRAILRPFQNVTIIIIINQFVTRQMPVSQVPKFL